VVFFNEKEVDMMPVVAKKQILDSNGFGRTLTRIAHEILEKNSEPENICLVGIKTRGIPIAKRLASKIKEIEGLDVLTGDLDISLYRDDLTKLDNDPQLQSANFEGNITGMDVVLIDDVIFTGRTARAAMDALIDHGRPRTIQLAVMVDRGHRELPIRPDYVGKNIPTAKNEIVLVRIEETDGEDGVYIGVNK
jgi:pyrimidine operon attenuation protein/uracil phosphoribosyltransferase